MARPPKKRRSAPGSTHSRQQSSDGTRTRLPCTRCARNKTDDFERAWDFKRFASLDAKVAPSLHSRDNLLPPHAGSLVCLVKAWAPLPCGMILGVGPRWGGRLWMGFLQPPASTSAPPTVSEPRRGTVAGPHPRRPGPPRTREVAGSCDPREAPDTDCRNCSETWSDPFSLNASLQSLSRMSFVLGLRTVAKVQTSIHQAWRPRPELEPCRVP